uniref:Uncharacterized protein n=1 Tax=Felis catus TaxID=9685 RepID=A0ABI7VU66_FELCA
RTSAGATSISGTSGTSRSIVPRATSSSAEGLVTCDSAARVKKRRLNQSTCTNSDIPLWLNTRKPPARKDGPLHHPTKDKTNRILYIMCGVLAVMLVGIFTKLGLEKAHRRQRKPSPDISQVSECLHWGTSFSDGLDSRGSPRQMWSWFQIFSVTWCA